MDFDEFSKKLCSEFFYISDIDYDGIRLIKIKDKKYVDTNESLHSNEIFYSIIHNEIKNIYEYICNNDVKNKNEFKRAVEDYGFQFYFSNDMYQFFLNAGYNYNLLSRLSYDNENEIFMMDQINSIKIKIQLI